MGMVVVASLAWFFACSSESGTDSSGGDAGAAGNGPNASGGTSQATGGGEASGGASTSGGAASVGGSAGVSGMGGDAAGGSAGGSAGGGTVVPPVDAGWPDVVFTYDAGDVGEPDACASTTVSAEPIPLDLIIVVDRSGSMNEPEWSSREWQEADCNIDEGTVKDSKWCRAINALMDFFESPSSVGMGVGFRTYAGEEEDCEAYPSLDVDFGIIQGGATDPLLAALEAEMNAQHAEGFTPTERALKTIIEFTTLRQQANVANGDTNRRVIGVLVTDGVPYNCNTDTVDLNQLVVDHNANTFFIGMAGADYEGLETMADGGGAVEHDLYCNTDAGPPCHYYDVGEGDGTVLVDALDEIRSQVIGCQFAVPTAETGLVDLDSIEVHFTPGGGAATETLTRVMGGEVNCGTSEGYYTDNDVTPTTILLCPATCTRADSDPDSSVSIELLCEGS
jgi:hypothetical protein